MALLSEFVYDYRENQPFIVQENLGLLRNLICEYLKGKQYEKSIYKCQNSKTIGDSFFQIYFVFFGINRDWER